MPQGRWAKRSKDRPKKVRKKWRGLALTLWELEVKIVREAFLGRGEDAPVDPEEEDE